MRPWSGERAGPLAAAALVAISAASGIARADPKLSAKQLAEEGQDLYEAGNYAEALDRFQRAEQTYHAPTILLLVARAQARLGHLLDARSVYDRVIGEQLPPDAPAPWRGAQEMAKSERDELGRRIAVVEVGVAGPPNGSTRLTIDGHARGAGDLAPIELDPGVPHRVSFYADGWRPEERSVAPGEGAHDRLEVRLQQTSAGSFLPPDVLRPAPLLAFGVAGAALGVGIVTGAMSLSKVGTLDDRCRDRVCLQSDRDTADSARTLGTVSTVAFVGAGLGIAAGITLVLLGPRFRSSAARITTAPIAAGGVF